MDNERRREANRRNAEKSTGPRSPEGKARSSRNATKHGLLAKRLVMPGEDPEELKELWFGMRRYFKPRGRPEEELVARMVSSTWRKWRSERIELGLLDWRGHVSSGKLPLAEVFFMDSQNDQSLQKLTRYMTACEREFHRALGTLRDLQAARRSEPDQDEAWEEEEGDDSDDPDDDGGGGVPSQGCAEERAEESEDETRQQPQGDEGESIPARDGTPPEDAQARVDEQADGGGGPRGDGASCSAGSPPPAFDRATEPRWNDLSIEEQGLFFVRQHGAVMGLDDLLFEASVNPYRLERLGMRQLLQQYAAFNRMGWQAMDGIGKILAQDEARAERGGGH